MTLEEIKQAIEDGHTVCWKNHAYEVTKTMTDIPNCQCSLGRASIYEHCDCTDSSCTLHHDSPTDIQRRQEMEADGRIRTGAWFKGKLDTPRPVYNIIFVVTDSMPIGLTHIDGVTMNGEEEDFYIKQEGE